MKNTEFQWELANWEPAMPIWLWLVATLSERDIEVMAKSDATVDALVWIDDAQRAGTYVNDVEKVREQRREDITRTSQSFVEASKRIESATKTAGASIQGLTNLLAGLESPDQEERDRYRAAYEFLVENFTEVNTVKLAPILGIVAEPRESKGRKQKPFPSEQDYAGLDEIKQMLFNGAAENEAIEIVAKKAKRTMSSHKATVDRLTRWWRWKMSLRNKDTIIEDSKGTIVIEGGESPVFSFRPSEEK